MRKIIFFLVLIIVFSVAILMVRSFFKQSTSTPIQLQKIAQKSQRIPKSWPQLLKKTIDKPNATEVDPTPSTTPDAFMLAPEEIALKLDELMQQLQTLDQESLQKTMALAEELILLEPDAYSAYKAKLLLLLVLEGKFQVEIDEIDVSTLFEQMASFVINQGALEIKEALLISQLANQMDQIANELEEIEVAKAQLGATEEFQAREDELLAQQQANQQKFEEGPLQASDFLHEELIDLSFQRMMAREEFAQALDNALDLIDQYPNFYIGYLYAYKALEAQGAKDEAMAVISERQLTPDQADLLTMKLSEFQNREFKNYWQDLHF